MTRSLRRYDGKVAVVTGASSGIGRRLALDLAGRGATVVALARRAELLDTLRAEAPAIDTHVCDVAADGAIVERLADVEACHGRIDILINNAGVHEHTPAADGLDALPGFDRIMATNFDAPVAATLAVLPGMLRRGDGIVVNVSSDSARAPEPREAAYAASKAALSTFTESVAHEVAGRGVHVHVLYPAWVPTAMGVGDGTGSPPPKAVRRTEQQISELLLARMGGDAVDINASWLPKLAVVGRTFVPGAYGKAMRRVMSS